MKSLEVVSKLTYVIALDPIEWTIQGASIVTQQ
jgi:hypothetical protein